MCVGVGAVCITIITRGQDAISLNYSGEGVEREERTEGRVEGSVGGRKGRVELTFLSFN